MTRGARDTWAAPGGAALELSAFGSARAGDPPAPRARPRGCPPEMARVGEYCIDRWEASMVDRRTGNPLSPYYPPARVLLRRVRAVWETERLAEGSPGARALPLPDISTWQRTHAFEPKAVSRPGVVPQGYLSYHLAKRACENAGKRLCTEDEWVTACKGRRGTAQPYGPAFERARCNVFRRIHPAAVLHDDASVGHTDPRLNLVVEDGQWPLLALTGATTGCVSQWGADGVYDMVGNLDEWIADEHGVFVGGFYARSTTKGCEARVASHAPAYYDYSLGTRCCADAAR
ncbi:MAG: SUMF1/EgtB/PvdO family nonheme iron enzyme [Sorangiineae bacterium]|nr:SUMF1/EgtB/PvdO family nonheme iron enzyme [Sorangiineae bacterium]